MSESGNSQCETTAPAPDQRPIASRRRRCLRRVGKIGGIILLSLMGLLGCVLGAVALILTPERLTPLVNRYSTQYLNAEVRFDTVNLSVFRHFPFVSVELWGGEIVSHAFRTLPDSARAQIPVQADTLLRFDRLSVSLNLPQLLAAQIAIRGVTLRNPQVFAYIAPQGVPNWNILKEDTTDEETESGEALPFQIRHLLLEGHGALTYESCPDTLFTQISLDQLKLSHLLGKHYRVELQSRLTLRRDTVPLCDTLFVGVRGGVKYDFDDPEEFGFKELFVQIGAIPLRFNGELELENESIQSHLQCSVHPLYVRQALALIPVSVWPMAEQIDTDLALDLDTYIDGTYRISDRQLPVLRAEVKCEGGYLRSSQTRIRVDTLKMDASLCYNPLNPDSTGVHLRSFNVQGLGVKLQGEMSAYDVLRNPQVNLNVLGTMQLDSLSTFLPDTESFTIRGRIGLNTKARFRMNDLTLPRIGKNRIDGTLSLDSVLIDVPKDTLFMMVDNGTIRFGSEQNRKDSLLSKGKEVLRLRVEVDTLNIDMKHFLMVATGDAVAALHSDAYTLSGDTTVVHPLYGSVEARSFAIASLDSTWIKSTALESRFSILPSPKDATKPLLHVNFDTHSMEMKGYHNKYDLYQGHIDLKMKLSSLLSDSVRRRHLLDSLHRVYPEVARDSLFSFLQKRQIALRQKDAFAQFDLDLTVDKDIAAWLRRWEAQGVIQADSGRVFTPYFPLMNILRQVDIAFTTDRIDLKETFLQSGSSSLELTGSLSNLRRTLLGRGSLKLNMKIESDTLNFNELLHAATVGANYDPLSSRQYREALSRAQTNEQLQQVLTEQSGVKDSVVSSPLLIIPSNIDGRVDLCAHYGIYGAVHFSKLHGALIVRDRCLQLQDLETVTDAGEMTLTALYATRSRNDIFTGFNLDMNRIKVNRLIELIPSVDTLLPMLRSFEGVVDCKIAATAAIDTLMNIDLSSLNAACSIHGEQMVLLDGETFTEIAKMLHFKNRQRNMIDRISVNMLVRDNQIELFPFVVEMDRYKAAVSGVHKLDMSFRYHISVLRSPIPFRLGINIFGTVDDFKVRLCRARYKNENIPSYVGLIDTTRINLSRTITDIFQKGIETASASDLKITPPSTDSVKIATEVLSKQDSMELKKEGILPADTVSVDSVSQGVDSLRPVAIDSLAPAQEPPKPLPATDPMLQPVDSTRRTPAEQRALRREERRKARQAGADAVAP
ncbi:MAG: AsmA-like C-terminal region-containing protein [Alistipes sp.]|nr:AsmA-like C-terminal region-containing protein [Alistipes sp.]